MLVGSMKTSVQSSALRYAVVSLRVPGADWIRLTEASMERYAGRFGLEVVHLEERDLNLEVLRWRRRHRNLHLEKFQLFNLLEDYDRILYVDADVLIHPEAPNVFDIVPEAYLGVVNEQLGEEAPKREQEWGRMQRRLGKLEREPGRYFNAGVLVVSRAHRELFAYSKRKFAAGRWPDQNTLNYYARQLGLPIRWLGPEWNCMPVFGERFQDPDQRRMSWFLHYAGEAAKAALREDLAYFQDA
jgi:lipopolysaccharide biosynthesis glycosyltransferase